MSQGSAKRWIYIWGKRSGVAAGALFAVLATVAKLPQGYEQWYSPLPQLIGQLKNNFSWIWIAAALLTVVNGIFRALPDPWIWSILRQILNQIQKVAYQDFVGQLNNHHRVTLFKHKKWRWVIKKVGQKYFWPWSGWLVPVLRSGHVSQKSKACFLASKDDINPQGVVGQSWGSNAITVASELPGLSSVSGDAQITKYTTRTFADFEHVKSQCKQGKNLPRSIGAVPIVVKGDIWGVLVLDSQNAQGVTDELMSSLTIPVGIIGQLLEKAN